MPLLVPHADSLPSRIVRGRVLLFVFFGLLVCRLASAQQQRDWEPYFCEWMDLEGNDGDAERIYDELCELETHPIDLNTATREDLERLPFLTDEQIEDICAYVYLYGPVKSLNELFLVESLDYDRRRLLQYFVILGEGQKERFPSFQELLDGGRNTLTATVLLPCYDRRGDRNGYLGYKYKHWLRYEFSSRNRLRVGLVASQDGGEPFASSGNRWGYDYYSPYIQVTDWGRLATLVVGRYRPSFGCGLVVGSSFSLGKQTALSSFGRPTEGIRAYTSRSEADYFQGIGATVMLSQRLKASAFLSYRPLDCTLNADGTAATIVSTGYHRTVSEMEKKNNTHAASAGGNVHYTIGGWHIGGTLVHTHLDRQLCPNTKAVFRRFYPAGTDFTNMSANYGYACHRFSVRGETALDRGGHVATVNSVSLRLSDRFDILAIQRFYAYRYAALHAHSFGDVSNVQNESGIYVGFEWQPSPRWHLSGYADYAYHPWPRYRVSRASHCLDQMLSVIYTCGNWRLGARYRLRLRQRNAAGTSALANVWEHRPRLSLTKTWTGGWVSVLQGNVAFSGQPSDGVGYMASHTLSREFSRLSLKASCAYFHTDSYDRRLYAYEPSLRYTFSFPMFYGEGIRYTLVGRLKAGPSLAVAAKVGVTNYFDRSVIGSGYQRIEQSSKADIEFQGTLKF